MKWNGLPLLIFGSGGISKETYNIIKQINLHNGQQVYDFLGFVEDDISKVGNEIIDGYNVITCDNDIAEYTRYFPVIGVVIPIGNPKVKSIIYNKINNIRNIVYPNIIHPSVKFDIDNVKLGIGNILTAGVNLTCDIKIGNFNLINLNCTVGHDTELKDYNVINPLVAISGNIIIKNGCLIGTGAKILQELTVNDNSIIGSGAVVVRDVEENSTVVGVPAKLIK
ncbi:acetyltransferase [Senegalia massiliensis]|uniref:Acetyltransferase n=1 Tax=Senegalia massiliensis TaxID=1720316 RepID=A0A845QZF5_9CLOT|nr:acetyltransferase [Senegalia massiliensis]NBI07139.1 acetyltransferase [Senegalia massiliensis]